MRVKSQEGWGIEALDRDNGLLSPILAIILSTLS